MAFTDDGHDLNVLSGIKSAIFHAETDTLNDYLQRYDYNAHEINQFADMAEMYDQLSIAENLRKRAKAKSE